MREILSVGDRTATGRKAHPQRENVRNRRRARLRHWGDADVTASTTITIKPAFIATHTP